MKLGISRRKSGPRSPFYLNELIPINHVHTLLQKKYAIAKGSTKSDLARVVAQARYGCVPILRLYTPTRSSVGIHRIKWKPTQIARVEERSISKSSKYLFNTGAILHSSNLAPFPPPSTHHSTVVRRELHSGRHAPAPMSATTADVTIAPRRLNGCSYLLTYAGLTPTAILPARMIAEVNAWATRKGILEWLACIEIHENPAQESHNHHWHVYVRFESRLDIPDHKHSKKFDIALADNTFAHPDIELVKQGASDRMRTLQYVAKDQGGEHPQLYGKMMEPIPCFAEKYRQHAEGDAQADENNNTPVAKKTRAGTWGDDLNMCTNMAECERMLRLDHANIYYMHWPQIAKNLQRRFRPTFVHPHTLRDFTLTLRDFNVEDWSTAGPIVVTGPTGVGKTTWVAAHANNPLIIKNIEDAREYEPGFHDVLILDDVNFRSRAPEWAIALLDSNIERTVDARYSPVRIPRCTPMIFTTNYPMTDCLTSIFPRGVNAQQQFAIERRFTTVRVATSLFN